MLMKHSDCRWLVVNQQGWKMPKSGANIKRFETHDGLIKFIQKQLTKNK